MVAHGHYSATFDPGGRFDSTPATPDLKGYDYVDQLYANYFYNNWTSPDGPFKVRRPNNPSAQPSPIQHPRTTHTASTFSSCCGNRHLGLTHPRLAFSLPSFLRGPVRW